MFASSDPNLTDLDFELLDERQQQQQQHQQQNSNNTNAFLNESMLKELLSGGSSNYRLVKTNPNSNNKRSSNQALRRQLVRSFSCFFLPTDNQHVFYL